MTADLSGYDSALKEVILPYIRDNFNTETVFMDQIKADSDVEFINDTFYVPVRSSRHGGVVNLNADTSTLRSGQAGVTRASVNSKNITGTFDITSKVIKATAKKEGAVESALMFQADSLLNDFRKDMNRQYLSDGYGVIAQVGGSVGAGTIGLTYRDANLDDTRSTDWYGSVNGDLAPEEYIYEGMAIGIGTGAADVGTVSSVSGTTVVVTGAPAIAANDAIYKVDGDDLLGGEIQGMRAALSTSTGTATYAGLPRSTYGWTPQVGTTAGALTVSEMTQKYLAARKYAMAEDKYVILMNFTLYQKYGDLLQAYRRTVNSIELVAGWTGLEFAAGNGKVAVFLDYDMPDGEVAILNLETWKLCQISDMEWVEEPTAGSLLRRRDKLTYQATMEWFANLVCIAPAANARLTQKTN